MIFSWLKKKILKRRVPVAFLHGKYFDSIEEMMAYAKDWPKQRADLKEYKAFLDMRYREAQCNCKVNPDFNNEMLYFLLRTNTDWVVNKNH